MLGCLADGSVLTGGNSPGEQVFEGMMGWAWEELTGDLGEMGWQRSLLGSPPISSSPRMRQQAHHPQASQNPDGSERKNMGFLEGAGAIWITSPTQFLIDWAAAAWHAQQQGPQGAEGCRLCPRAVITSRRQASRLPPPRLPGADSAPRNKQSPTVTADTHHSPPVLPRNHWGLG